MHVERYSKVMHLVSDVKGLLRDDKTALDALLAVLPAGTLSGAPKVRAMQPHRPIRKQTAWIILEAPSVIWGFDGNIDTFRHPHRTI